MTMLISTIIGSESRAIKHYHGHARVATGSPAFSEQPSSSVRPWGESVRRHNQGTVGQVRRGLGVTTRGRAVRGTHAAAGLG
jgi:hypothetical protein